MLVGDSLRTERVCGEVGGVTVAEVWRHLSFRCASRLSLRRADSNVADVTCGGEECVRDGWTRDAEGRRSGSGRF